MSVFEPTETLRRGALDLLDSGNSVESVAHVFGVSVDAVRAWRDGPAEAPQDADMSDSKVDADAGQARPAGPIRFDETLDYSTSTAYRRAMFCMALVLLAMLACFVFAVLHGHVVRSGDKALAVIMTLAISPGVLALFGFSRLSLVLDDQGIVVPGVFRNQWMPYSEVAGYSIKPAAILAFRGEGVHGEMLRIDSLRPGASPLEVFIAPHYPLDGDIIRRLDEVSRANRARRKR